MHNGRSCTCVDTMAMYVYLLLYMVIMNIFLTQQTVKRLNAYKCNKKIEKDIERAQEETEELVNKLHTHC